MENIILTIYKKNWILDLYGLNIIRNIRYRMYNSINKTITIIV